MGVYATGMERYDWSNAVDNHAIDIWICNGYVVQIYCCPYYGKTGIKMKKIEDINILVVGDIMLDHYILGDVERISPEAPVPVVKATKDIYSLGGCGNVVCNLAELGVQTTCMATIGHDNAGTIIWTKLVNINCRLIQLPNDKITTQKIRIIGGETQTQMLRIDREDSSPIEYPNSTDNYFVYSGYGNHGDSSLGVDYSYDIIAVADYGKGVITRGLMDKLKTLNTPIIIDPKPENIDIYNPAPKNNVFMITPNQKEWHQIRYNQQRICRLSDFKYVLITKGRDGMELLSFNKIPIEIPTIPVQVFNVSGAGDTVVAIMAVCTALGFDPEKSAHIANECAGYVVTQPGTSVVPKGLFFEIVNKYN